MQDKSSKNAKTKKSSLASNPSFIQHINKYGTDFSKFVFTSATENDAEGTDTEESKTRLLQSSYEDYFSMKADHVNKKGEESNIFQIQNIYRQPDAPYFKARAIIEGKRQIQTVVDLKDTDYRLPFLLKDLEFRLKQQLSYIKDIYSNLIVQGIINPEFLEDDMIFDSIPKIQNEEKPVSRFLPEDFSEKIKQAISEENLIKEEIKEISIEEKKISQENSASNEKLPILVSEEMDSNEVVVISSLNNELFVISEKINVPSENKWPNTTEVAPNLDIKLNIGDNISSPPEISNVDIKNTVDIKDNAAFICNDIKDITPPVINNENITQPAINKDTMISPLNTTILQQYNDYIEELNDNPSVKRQKSENTVISSMTRSGSLKMNRPGCQASEEEPKVGIENVSNEKISDEKNVSEIKILNNEKPHQNILEKSPEKSDKSLAFYLTKSRY